MDIENNLKNHKSISVEFVVLCMFQKQAEDGFEQSLYYLRLWKVNFVEADIGEDVDLYLRNAEEEVLARIS